MNHADLQLEVVMERTEELVPYANNAKTHTSKQIEQICTSIEEFGFADPVGVWTNADGESEIVEGHGRVLAAQKLGIEEVPVIHLDALTDEQRRAYMLAHNQLTMNTGWDEALLENELNSLNDVDMAVFGFDAFDAADAIDMYSKRVDSPYYGEGGRVVTADECYVPDRCEELLRKIKKAKLDPEVESFLSHAAHRFTRFDYQTVAEYYACCGDETVKALMEELALVIPDYDRAIQLGFVKLDAQVAELEGVEDDE